MERRNSDDVVDVQALLLHQVAFVQVHASVRLPVARDVPVTPEVHIVALIRACELILIVVCGVHTHQVGQRIHVQQLLAVLVDPVRRDKVAGERLAVCRVLDSDELVILLGLGEIANALRSARHGLERQGVEQARALLFEVGEEEELVLVPVHLPGDVDRSADLESLRAVAGAGAGQAAVVVGPRVGVHPLVLDEHVGPAVEVLGAALGHHHDVGAGGASKFRLLAVGHHLELGDDVAVEPQGSVAVVADILVGHAVHLHGVLVRPQPVGVVGVGVETRDGLQQVGVYPG